ncbi:MAG: WD40 repeat domain-containing protein [Bacteroidota bacterium]|nr:WD40 repeat domain-containing protein [Bacteroidota bacterium]
MKRVCIILAFFIFTLTSFSQKFIAHEGQVNDVAYCPSGKYLASCGTDKTVKIWNMETRTLEKTLNGHDGSVEAICFSPNGKYLLSGGADNIIKVWDVETGNLIKDLSGHTNIINAISYSPDGRFFASASSDHTVLIWDMKHPNSIATLQLIDLAISVNFSPNSRYIITGGEDNFAKIWDTEHWKLQKSFWQKGGVNSVCFSHNGNYVVTGGADKSVTVYEFASGNKVWDMKGHTNWVTDAIFSPDDNYIISAGLDNSIKIWSVKNGKLINSLDEFNDKVKSICMSSDGKYLIRASMDSTIRILKTSELYAPSKNINASASANSNKSTQVKHSIKCSKTGSTIDIINLTYKDNDGNNILNQSEKASINITFTNIGKKDIYNAKIYLEENSPVKVEKDIYFNFVQPIGLIKAGSAKTINFPISTTSKVTNRNTSFKIIIYDNNQNFEPVFLDVKVANKL